MDFPAGWINDPEEVAVVVEQQPFASFDLTPIGTMSSAPLQPFVYLWEVYKRFTGHDVANENQGQIGSCVSFGTEMAVKMTIAAQHYSRRASSTIDLVQEEIYGGSRVEIGKKRIHGDGSIGAWAAQLVQRYGVIPRGIWGKYDLSKYDVHRCRDWGQNGIPDDLEPECRKRIVKEITLVKNWEMAKLALSNGHGIAVSSSQGFTMDRDSDGFARPRGAWNHCMALIGYTDGRRPGGFIQNSWGANAHTGPLGPGNPPSGGFWVDASVVDGMLKQGDSWAFSSVDGFRVQNNIDWSSI